VQAGAGMTTIRTMFYVDDDAMKINRHHLYVIVSHYRTLPERVQFLFISAALCGGRRLHAERLHEAA